jgi:hypothetical protein
MRSVFLFVLVVTVSACAPVPPPVRSPQAETHLQQLLSGRVPGPPVSCLPDYRSNDMVVIDDSTVLYRDGRTVYRNDFEGGSCNHLGSGFFALLTRRVGGIGLCRGDIAEVIDTSTGMTVGSCTIGDFVPYTKPRS